MAERLLIVDVETTSLDPATGHIVELGAALCDAEHGLITCASTTVQAAEHGGEGVHGIPAEAVAAGIPRGAVPAMLARMSRGEPVTHVAWNAAFDRAWLPPLDPWLCAMDDAEWPRPSTSRSLVAVALAHGVGVSRAHRAIDDVLTLVALLDRVRESDPGLVEWLRIAREPRALVVGHQAFEENDIAKSHGFRWDPEMRKWACMVRESMVTSFVEGLPFRAEIRSKQ